MYEQQIIIEQVVTDISQGDGGQLGPTTPANEKVIIHSSILYISQRNSCCNEPIVMQTEDIG